MAHDGELSFGTKLDETGFSSGIGKLGSIAKGGMAVLGASVLGATAAFAGLSKAALDSVASLEQNVGGVETLFKDNAKTVIENANNAYKTAGLSANEYMQNVTSFSASLLQSVSGDTEEAARIADMAMVDMSDNANKMGTDMQSIQNAYQGFAKQNYTMLDNLKLGYGGTKEEMQRLLADASEFSGMKYDISSLDDVYSAIHVIQGELDITGTTALEASTTIEGSMNAAKAAFDNFLNGSGSADDLAQAVATAIGNIAENLGEIIPRLAETVPQVIGALAEEFSGSADQFIQMGTGILTQIVAGLVEGLPAFIEFAVSFLETLIQSLNENMPLLLEAGGALLVALVQGVMTLLPSLLSLGWSIISGIIQGIVQNAPQLQAQAGSVFSQFLTVISTRFPELLKQGSDALGQFIQGVLSRLPDIIAGAGTVISSLLDAFLDALPGMLEAGVRLIMQLVQGILSNLPEVIGAANSALIEIIATIASHLPEILQKGIELIGQLAAGLIEAIPDLVGKIPEMVTTIGNKFMEYDWLQIGVDIVKGIATGLANSVSMVVDAAASVGEAALNGLKELLGIHSPSRVFRDEVGRYIALGIAEGISRNKKYAGKSAEEIAQATLDAAKKKLDNYKVYNKLSLAEEAGFWDEVRKQTAEGTQARTDADKEYLTAKKSLNDQMADAEKSYTDKVADAYKNLNDKIKDLNSQYEDAVEARTGQIKDAFGLFDKFDSGTDLTADDLLDNLQSQVDGLRDWRSNLKDLDGRGIGDELLEELQNLGPQAAAQIRLMTEMSDDQLDEYVRLFRQKNRIARKQAVEELEPMSEEISGQIRKIQQETSAELSKYQQEYTAAMTDLGVSLSQPLEDMKLAAAQNAVALVSEMAGAVKDASGTAENMDKFKAIAENVLSGVGSLPGSMTDMGKLAVTGMAEGIKAMSGQLSGTMQTVVSGAMQAAAKAMTDSGAIEALLSGTGSVTGTVSIPAGIYGSEGHGPGQETDYKRFGQAVSSAVSGMSVIMDGNRVGSVVAGSVNAVLGGQGQIKGRDGH